MSRARSILPLFLFTYAAIHLCGGQEVSRPVVSAQTAFLIARLGTVGAGKYSPDAKRAKRQVERLLRKWGRYQLVDSPAKADLVLIITEGHTGTYGREYAGLHGGMIAPDVLSDTLVVYGRGPLDETKEPLWRRTESGDDFDWPAERVVKKFRKAVEKASK